jgi:hypothetical protein
LRWFLPCNIPTLPTMATRFIPRVAILTADMPAEFHSDRPTFDLAIWFLEHRTHAYTSFTHCEAMGPSRGPVRACAQCTGLELGPDYISRSVTDRNSRRAVGNRSTLQRSNVHINRRKGLK